MVRRIKKEYSAGEARRRLPVRYVWRLSADPVFKFLEKHLDQIKWLPKGSTCTRRGVAGGRKPGR